MLCRWTLFSLFAVSLIHLIKADRWENKKPDFRAPGRRISEQKCREFNWARKHPEKSSLGFNSVNDRRPGKGCRKPLDAGCFQLSEMMINETLNEGALGHKREGDTSWTFLCASFLISSKFAMTSAHCTRSRYKFSEPVIIRFSNEYHKDDIPRLDVKIRRMISHPEFKPPIRYYDIALLELESEVPFSKSIYPACLWPQASLDGVEYANNQGWWFNSIKGAERKIIAQEKVKVLDRKTCSNTAKRYLNELFKELQDHHMCADESTPSVKCRGAGGAPLITAVSLDGNKEDEMPYAFAVFSFGRHCGGFGIYTKVSNFIDWIEQTVWPEAGSAIVFKD